MRFKNPNTSRISKNKIAALFDRIVRRNGQRARGGIFDILSDLFVEFKKFFTKSKSPKFEFTPLVEGDVVSAEKYNDTLQDAIEDVSVCTDEVDAIKPIVIGSYNSARQMAKELENRSETALSKITDIRLFEGQLGQEIIVMGDDFLSIKKIDNKFSLNAPSADIRTAEGLVTLNRAETVNLVDEDTSVTCEPTMPGSIETGPSKDSTNSNRYYEGNFYNFIGNARPEGGNWHLEERLHGLSEAMLSDELTATKRNGAPTTFTEDLDDVYIPGTSLRPQDIIIYDRGATENEKNNVRRRMFDEDSSSFWEAEYVVDFSPTTTRSEIPAPYEPPEPPQSPLQAAMDSLISTNGVPLSTILSGLNIWQRNRLQNGTLTPEEMQNLGLGIALPASDPDAQDPVVHYGDEEVDMTAEELAAEAANQDGADFEVQITVDLGKEKPVTWLSLDPINFGETAWLEITDIATQSSEEEGFKTIPNLFNNRFANTLTNEANEELQADVASQILAPDRSSFKGKGVFNFPTVSAQYIRIKVKQKVPVPNLYQRLNVQMTRSIDTTTTRTKKKSGFLGFGGSSKSSTTISQTRMSKLVKLTYLQTVKTYNNNAGIGEYAGETDGSSSNVQSSSGGPRSGLIGFLADLIFGSKSSSTNVSSTDTGWGVAKSWLQVSYNKMRYAIGVRELSIFNYKFSPTSEFVTKKFTSPKEIIKAQLEVVEEIPPGFDPTQRYIEYYLSFDDENWHRVNPTGSPTLYLEDGQIAPEILSINFDVAGPGANQKIRNISTTEPATSVRLKVIMKTDPSVEDSEMYSPVLKKYRVKLFPRTSLSRA